jgi:hypothetical protein
MAGADPAAVLRLHHAPQVQLDCPSALSSVHGSTYLSKAGIHVGWHVHSTPWCWFHYLTSKRTCWILLDLSAARRLTWLDHFVPFDFAIPFHMMVAMIGGVLAIVHASCHITDYAHAVRSEAHTPRKCITESMRCDERLAAD